MHISQNDIGKRLLLDTNTMTPLLQRMEKAGLITRTRGKEDTRQRIVALTKEGKALYEQAEQIPHCMRKAVSRSLTLKQILQIFKEKAEFFSILLDYMHFFL